MILRKCSDRFTIYNPGECQPKLISQRNTHPWSHSDLWISNYFHLLICSPCQHWHPYMHLTPPPSPPPHYSLSNESATRIKLKELYLRKADNYDWSSTKLRELGGLGLAVSVCYYVGGKPFLKRLWWWLMMGLSPSQCQRDRQQGGWGAGT